MAAFSFTPVAPPAGQLHSWKAAASLILENRESAELAAALDADGAESDAARELAGVKLPPPAAAYALSAAEAPAVSQFIYQAAEKACYAAKLRHAHCGDSELQRAMNNLGNNRRMGAAVALRGVATAGDDDDGAWASEALIVGRRRQHGLREFAGWSLPHLVVMCAYSTWWTRAQGGTFARAAEYLAVLREHGCPLELRDGKGRCAADLDREHRFPSLVAA